jgi:hypothetical protein
VQVGSIRSSLSSTQVVQLLTIWLLLLLLLLQATGLALPGSDLDVVLLRVPGCPLPNKIDKGFG